MRRIILFALIIAAATLGAVSTAAAQPTESAATPSQPPGFRTPLDEAAPNRTPVTSGATTPKPVSIEEQRKEKALAVAVFAKPAAAKKATDKIEDANAPPIPPAEPKPEWTDKGFEAGGKGVIVKKPF